MLKNYINGSEISISKETSPVEDPSKGEKIADVVMSTEADFKLAIESAKNAQHAKRVMRKRLSIISEPR